MCGPRCFCFRRPRVGTMCRCAAAQVPPFLAPLSSPASCSSTHTHNTQVPASSMPPPTARATIPRLVRALFAVSASPGTPAAGTPLHSLSAEHAAARSPSALEGPLTRATHRHPLLLPRPLCANVAPHRCSRSACSAVRYRQAHASTPILQFKRLSSPCAISQ